MDVGCLAAGMKRAVEAWMGWIEAHPSSPEAIAVETNLQSLIRVAPTEVKLASTATPSFVVIKTN